MKTLFKSIAVLLSILMSFHSCAVYTGNYTLDQAVTEKRKAKITTVDESVLIFEKIVTLNGEFVGVQHKRNQSLNVTLDEAQVNQVQLINKGRTNRNNTTLIWTTAAVAAGVILIVILAKQIEKAPLY